MENKPNLRDIAPIRPPVEDDDLEIRTSRDVDRISRSGAIDSENALEAGRSLETEDGGDGRSDPDEG